jgi:hypothetical protein
MLAMLGIKICITKCEDSLSRRKSIHGFGGVVLLATFLQIPLALVPPAARAKNFEYQFTCQDQNGRTSSAWMDERISDKITMEDIRTDIQVGMYRRAGVDHRYMLSCNSVCLRLIPLDQSTPQGGTFRLQRLYARTSSPFNEDPSWEIEDLGNPDSVDAEDAMVQFSNTAYGARGVMLKACWNEKWTDSRWLIKYYKDDPGSTRRFITKVNYTEPSGQVHQFTAVPYTDRNFYPASSYRENGEHNAPSDLSRQRYEYQISCTENASTLNSGWMDERISDNMTMTQLKDSDPRDLHLDHRYMLSCDKVCLNVISLDPRSTGEPALRRGNFAFFRKYAHVEGNVNTPISWTVDAVSSSADRLPDTVQTFTVEGPEGSQQMVKHRACWDDAWTDDYWLLKYSKQGTTRRFMTSIEMTDPNRQRHTFNIVPFTTRELTGTMNLRER